MPTINRGLKPRENTARKKSYQHIYQNKRWKAVRAAKFMNNPVCELCEQKGIVSVTKEVHHVVPFMSVSDEFEQDFLAFDYDNLQSLCVECHKNEEKKLKK